jgi:hypothetical protein
MSEQDEALETQARPGKSKQRKRNKRMPPDRRHQTPRTPLEALAWQRGYMTAYAMRRALQDAGHEIVLSRVATHFAGGRDMTLASAVKYADVLGVHAEALADNKILATWPPESV